MSKRRTHVIICSTLKGGVRQLLRAFLRPIERKRGLSAWTAPADSQSYVQGVSHREQSS
jgi:hypothetical protein